MKIYYPTGPTCAYVLLIDHYDSFTYNLTQALCIAGAQVTVCEHDQVSLSEILAPAYTHYVISPGPGRPERERDFKVSRELLHALPHSRPLLGVCLGLQGIAAHFGATVTHAPRVMHGKVSRIMHDQDGLFRGLSNPLPVMRYHSLCVDTATLPDELIPTAWCPQDGVLMGIRHHSRPIFGVQFHPESVGTPRGPELLQSFLRIS